MPPTPTPAADVHDVIDDAIKSSIGRVVAALSVPILGVVTAVLYWLQNAIGIDLQVDPAAAASFIGALILGGALIVLKWLEGRQVFERGAMEVLAAYTAGRELAVPHAAQTGEPDDGEPTVPLGLR